MPFVSLGLCPEFASSLLVPLNAGYHKAVEKLLLAEPISASEAVEMRIVNACCRATMCSILRSSRPSALTICRRRRYAPPRD